MSLSAIHPWNLFLLIISVPSLLAGILFSFAPESPKFLMSRGKNREALAVFQEIYRRNHNYGEFPIKTLANEMYVAEKKDKDSPQGQGKFGLIIIISLLALILALVGVIVVMIFS